MEKNLCPLFKNISVFLIILATSISAQQISFTEVAGSMGINKSYNGQFLGGGVSFYDFDRDGLEDISLTSGAGEHIYLFHNEGNHFLDIRPNLAISDVDESETILWADYDNDGDPDLLTINFLGQNKLYRNNGGEIFLDVTSSAGLIQGILPGTAATWGDIDNDGWLDLYVTNYSSINNAGVVPNTLYRNNGDGTFQDITSLAGVADSVKQPLAVVFVDYDNDGWQDIYIANDKRNGNTLFKNNRDLTFSDVSAASGSDLAFDAMGLAVGDYDNNGFLDIYVSNGEEGNGLLRNNGDGTFTDVAFALGVAVERVCWGTNFLDYDNDGDLDLFVCVSNGIPDRENRLFENNGDGTFMPAQAMISGNNNRQSYGTAIGDFNSDGFYDIAVVNVVNNFCLWENSGNMNNWFKIYLEGSISNTDGIGSLIEIYQNGNRRILSTHSGISYLSQNTNSRIVGLGAAHSADAVLVRWPNGTVNVQNEVTAGELLRVREQGDRFENFTVIAAVDHTYEPLIESSIGGGVAFGDYDNDGQDDLIIATGQGQPLQLFHNEDGQFQAIGSGQSGLQNNAEVKSVLWGDYDNDGDEDLFVANFGTPNQLFQNNANGTFTDMSASAGFTYSYQSTAAAWVDYNNDGFLDLYVTNYGGINGAGDEPNVLYHNEGGGEFTDVTVQAGLVGGIEKKPLAVAFFDHNNDGWQDVYIANDKEQGNLFYENNGDGTFSDITVSSGTGYIMDAMGIAILDYNRDGNLDFYVTNGVQGNVLGRNNGDGTFTDVAPQLGVVVNRECWGTNTADFNNDGYDDLFVAVADGVVREDVLFLGEAGGFRNITAAAGLADNSLGYGSAVGDYNRDGRVDIFVSNRQFAGGKKSFLYQNRLDSGNWLRIKLIGAQSNRSAIGARVTVTASAGDMIQEIRGGSSYLSQNSRLLTFGLGEDYQANQIVVDWPSGLRTTLSDVAAGQQLEIDESMTAISDGDPVTEGFELLQNYPNPFNPQTNIEYRISDIGYVSLAVYDVLGRKVRTLVGETMQPGSYTVTWNGRNDTGVTVSSGIYFYRLAAGEFIRTRRMLLMQ